MTYPPSKATLTGRLRNISSSTKIIGGDGEDTLFFKSGSFTFDTRNFKGIQGVDVFDLMGTTTPKLYIGPEVVDAADGDSLVLRVGSQGLGRLETADLPSTLEVVVEGPGEVQLGTKGAEIGLSKMGKHYVVGESGRDTVRAGDSGDRIELAGGDDTIIGGKGNDIMAGGSGSDTFIFTPGDGHDVIKDWNGVDNLIFDGFDAGATFSTSVLSEGLLLTLSDDQSILLSGIPSKVISAADVDWI